VRAGLPLVCGRSDPAPDDLGAEHLEHPLSLGHAERDEHTIRVSDRPAGPALGVLHAGPKPLHLAVVRRAAPGDDPVRCTPAPYYDPDPSCPDGQGFHHGNDVAIPCGTELYAGRRARVLTNDALGPAYGENPVLLRVSGRDVVIGHTRRVFVRVGDRLVAGDRFALVGDSAASDGCHLHFEVRPAGAGYLDAVDPLPLLDLTPSS
jgi:murein DD-endopeptidase MepM/ murein hydrolase activator NlpD